MIVRRSGLGQWYVDIAKGFTTTISQDVGKEVGSAIRPNQPPAMLQYVPSAPSDSGLPSWVLPAALGVGAFLIVFLVLRR